MDHFTYVDGALHCERVPVAAIAERAGTPCYVYSRATLVEHYRRLAASFEPLDPLICYSIKSCSNLSVCRVLAECGAGMDLVSGGELHRARLAGVDPGRCVYAGVGKTDAEIRGAIEAGVGWLNVESAPEFEQISAVARDLGTTCRAALRVNPDVDARTHRYTTTGVKATKFGVDADRARGFFERYGDDPHCRLGGLHVHIGSPVLSVEPYVESIGKVVDLMDDVRPLCNGGAGIEMLDLGGGFGADYVTDQSPRAADYAERLVPILEPRVRTGLRIVLEPGRSIAANAGILLVGVMFVKGSGGKTFVICDGGMNCLIRPALYEAFHFIWPARVPQRFVPARRAERVELPDLVPVDVVGPICETGDFLALDRHLPPVERGDLLAVFAAGAYGMSMSNRYNSSPLPAEILVDGAGARVVRRRETYDDLTSHELEPVELVLDSAAASGRTGQERSMIKRDEDGLWIVLEETIGNHHDETFACLTTPAGLTRWFPVTAEIEPRPGGHLILGWDPQMKRKTTVAVLDHDAGGTIVWDWYAGHEDRHAPVYLEVRPSMEDGSLVQLRQGPFASDEDSLIAMANEAASWTWRLCNLRSVLESKHDMRRVRPL